MFYWFCEIFQFLGFLGFKSSYMGYLNFESAKKNGQNSIIWKKNCHYLKKLHISV